MYGRSQSGLGLGEDGWQQQWGNRNSISERGCSCRRRELRTSLLRWFGGGSQSPNFLHSVSFFDKRHNYPRYFGLLKLKLQAFDLKFSAKTAAMTCPFLSRLPSQVITRNPVLKTLIISPLANGGFSKDSPFTTGQHYFLTCNFQFVKNYSSKLLKTYGEHCPVVSQVCLKS